MITRLVSPFILAISVFLIFVDFSYLKLNTADSSLYLSTAENIADHRGFVVSDNLYQSFNTYFHPLWPYYQPLYSLFISMVINHGGIVKVIQVNILFLALNAMLIFCVLQELIPSYLNILFIFLLVLSYNFFISALYAWTEQFYFFCFFVTFILFLKFGKSTKHLMWLGFLNGVLMLIRMAHFYNFLAYLPIIFIGVGPLRRKIERLTSFVSTFALAYGLYQLFCFTSYHVFYPECPRAAMSYVLSFLIPGTIYVPHKVGIQVALGSFFSFNSLSNVGSHLMGFLQQMTFFIWPAMFYFFIPIHKRTDGGLVVLCLLQGFLTIMGYSLTFYALPSDFFETIRYSLIPFVMISIAGWYSLCQGMSLSESWGKTLLVGFMMFSFLFQHVEGFNTFKTNAWLHPFWGRPHNRDLMASYDWVDKNLPKNILVASNDDQQGYFMHRPFISTPQGESFNCSNLSLFNQIYSPDYYLLSLNKADKCFTAIPHSTVFSNRNYMILKVVRNDGQNPRAPNA